MNINLEITPGDILFEEFIAPSGITQKQLADSIGIPASRINEIVKGKRAISAETALRLSTFWGNSAQFWMNLQAHYDLERAETECGAAIRARVHPLAS